MMERHRFEAAWYGHGFLRELVLIYPSYGIMIGEHGISPIELSTLFILWTGTALLLEVPSGTLADRRSRKQLLVVSGVVKCSTFLVWWLWPTFPGYALGFVLWGAGSSLISGTSESFLFDALKARGDPEAFSRIYGRGVAANSVGVATALLGGGFLAEGGYTTPLLLSILGPLGAALVAALAFEEPPRSHGKPHEDYLATLRAGLRAVSSQPGIRYLVMALAVLGNLYGALEEYVGPYLDEKPQFTLGAVGVVYAAAFGARALGVAFAHRLPPLSPRQVSAMYALSALPLGATLTGAPIGTALALCTYFAISTAGEVLLQGSLQARIDGATRATVTSVAGMGQQLIGILVYLHIGTIAEQFTWHIAVATICAITLMLGTAFALPRVAADRASGSGRKSGSNDPIEETRRH